MTRKLIQLKKEYEKYSNKELSPFLRLVDFIWRKKYRQSLVIVWAIGIIFIFLGEFLVKFIVDIENITFGEKVLGAIAFSTAVIVFWYTRETFDLKVIQQKELQEVRKQTNFEMRPYLRLQWSNDPMRPRDVFEIINNGRGLAIDVKFDKFDIKYLRQVIRFSIKNRPLVSNMGGSIVSIIELDETKKVIKGGNLSVDNIKDYIETAGFSGSGFSIIVKYRDIEDHKYIAVFKSDKSYNDKFRIEFQDLASEYKVKKSKN